jgi:hypothetical protein
LSDDYVYPAAQCDVAPDRRGALQSYRDKRRLWLSWIDSDEHHEIWTTLSSMVWTDTAFKVLAQFAIDDEDNALNNTLLGPRLRPGETTDAETLILNQVNLKRAKGGAAYAEGKTLAVFLDAWQVARLQ